MDIIETFPPTYLYIKQHSVTGLLYFGKTQQIDPNKYFGSGKYWKLHIKKHGKQFVEHMWDKLFINEKDLVEYALDFSIRNNIVESNLWANLKIENGLDGNPVGVVLTEEHRRRISEASKGRKPFLGHRHSEESKQKISDNNARLSGEEHPMYGKNHTDESRAKMSKSHKNMSDENRKKITDSRIGKPCPQKQVICPHCELQGANSNMKRYHFDNCKKRI